MKIQHSVLKIGQARNLVKLVDTGNCDSIKGLKNILKEIGSPMINTPTGLKDLCNCTCDELEIVVREKYVEALEIMNTQKPLKTSKSKRVSYCLGRRDYKTISEAIGSGNPEQVMEACKAQGVDWKEEYAGLFFYD